MRIIQPNLNNRQPRYSAWQIAMWIVLLLCVALIFSSCSTLHKTKSSQKISIDSSGNKEVSAFAVDKIDSSASIKRTDSTGRKTEAFIINDTRSGFKTFDADSGSTVEFRNGTASDYSLSVIITNPDGKKKILLPYREEHRKETKSTQESKTSSSEDIHKLNSSDSSGQATKETAHKTVQVQTKDKDVHKTSYAWIWWAVILIAVSACIRYRKKIFPWLRLPTDA
ncbi:MAG: hypothetical protein WKF88_09255 [Ferruginibacter sp.]